MGKISKQLKRNLLQHLNKKVIDLTDLREAKKEADKAKEILKDLQKTIECGTVDQLHRTYVSTIGLIASCMYGLANLKEMNVFQKISKKQESLYIPGGPPISPLTDSYYSLWELFDLHFGSDKETLGSVFLDLAPELKLQEDTITIIDILNSSRMGIYEVTSIENDKLWLNELITSNKFFCTCPAGYKGKVGQLWLARLLPPVFECVNYSVVMTTPYVLFANKQEWLDFFNRNNIDKESLHDFMKHGPFLNYWHEFIFYGFFNYTDQAIFLGGIPDRPSSLPCSEQYNEHEKNLKNATVVLREDDKDKIIKNSNMHAIYNDVSKQKDEELPSLLRGKKASEVFLEYAMPLINNFDIGNNCDLKDIHMALEIPWLVWNACVFESSKNKNTKMMLEIKQQSKNDKKLMELISFFEQRKKISFADYNYLMGEYKLIPQGCDGFKLRMECRSI